MPLLKLKEWITYRRMLPWLYSTAVSIGYLLIFGYHFNQGDQAEHLPQVYQLLNPELYANDFFIGLYNQTFTVREYWVKLVYVVSKCTGVPVACFALHVCCLIFTSAAWISISRSLTGDHLSGYIAVPLLLVVFNSFTIGGNTLQGNLFIGSTVAEALASWAFVFFLRSKIGWCSVLLGLSTLFQAIVGLQWLLLLGGLQFLHGVNRRSIKTVFRFFMVYLIVSSPMLIPVLLRQFRSVSTYDAELFYTILFRYRNYLHYLPSCFPLSDYLKYGALLIASAGCFFYLRPNARKLLMVWFGVWVIGGCVVYFVLLEAVHIHAIGKLQWFKATVWLNAICCVVIAGAVSVLFEKPLLKLNKQHIVLPGLMVIIMAGMFVLTNSVYLPEKFRYRYQVAHAPQSDRQKMHEWIRKNMDVDAVFLVEPENDAFTCEAQRAMPVNYKAVVHEPFYLLEWYQRMKAYYAVDFENLGEKTPLKAAQKNYETILQYPENGEAQYRIDNLETCTFADRLQPAIHRQGKWIITPVK